MRILVVGVALAVLAASAPRAVGDEWPTRGWRTATPESQGMDSSVLADVLAHARTERIPVHSVLIVRHGLVVLDATFYPFEPDTPHDIASATKSVTSILIGIALDKGYLKSVEEPVLRLLPGAAPAVIDRRKQRLTIEHLLTMTSGLDCGVESGERELAAMRQSKDWAAFALGLPMRAEPGSQYAYCSCNNHLLSAILSARTGDSALVFARKHLFGPLGIQDVTWPADPLGRNHGWGDLQLQPRDFAKIGFLYLHGGRWNGSQVVSEEWVRAGSPSHRTLVRRTTRHGRDSPDRGS